MHLCACDRRLGYFPGRPARPLTRPAPAFVRRRPAALCTAVAGRGRDRTSKELKVSLSPAVMEFYNLAVNMFIRPPRAQYEVKDLGPARFNIGASLVAQGIPPSHSACCRRPDFCSRRPHGK